VVKWKTLSKVLSVGMIASAIGLAGCSSSSTTSGSKADSSAPYEVKMAYFTFGPIDSKELASVQQEVNKITKPKINATVKLMPLNFSAYQQQMNLMLSGSQQLDLFVGGTLMGLSNQVARGQLIPMDDLLKKDGQDILKVIPESVVDASKINGKSYVMPEYKEFGADYGIEMRKDLVDKYHIDLTKIKTWSDLEPVYAKIEAGEPNMAAIANQTQAATIAYDMVVGIFDGLGDTFGVVNMVQKSTKVVNLYGTEEYKSAVNMVHDWYQKGYVVKDAATNQQTGSQLAAAGKTFSYTSNMKPGFDVQETQANKTPMIGVHLTPAWAMTSGANGFGMSIPKNSKNPEKAMQFLNLLYKDKDLENLVANGIEGKHYTKNADGTITIKPNGGYSLNEWEIGNNALTDVYQGNPTDIWDQYKKFNDSLVPSPAYGFTFDSTNVKSQVAAVTNVANQYRAGLETGTTDPAKTLPKFIDALKAAGINDIIAEKQKQLDAFLKTKK
jgi:putative aldouronate transport system substrate-binding protein